MTPAQEVAVAQIQVMADALDVLTSADSPANMAAKMNGLTEMLGQIATARQAVDADELKDIEAELEQDEDVQKLVETLGSVIATYGEKDFGGSAELKAAIEAFGAALSAL